MYCVTQGEVEIKTMHIIIQSVPITTDAMSSNLDQDEVYNIMW
jgi:alpha-acetolactate decarboxylase